MFDKSDRTDFQLSGQNIIKNGTVNINKKDP